jgi:carboxyl-terminal processing protease
MESKVLRNILIIFISVVLLTGAFSGGLLVGRSLNPSAETSGSTPANVESLFAPFWETWTLVHQEFVNQPVDDVALMRGAIKGMLDSLGDQHTSYMDPQEFQQVNTSLTGEYEGIGAYVDTTGKLLTVVNPIPNTPADKAGIKAGDQIIAVDDKDVTKLSPDLVLRQVLGPAGTKVKLTILRPGLPDPFTVEVVRAKIPLTTVDSKMLDNNIAYIHISTFGEKTTDELKTALTTLLAQKPKALILDLRNNTGGYLNTAIEVISQFIPKGTVMYEEFGNGKENKYDAIPGGMATDIPMVVLVNEWSASASEITAGAIQDFNRGKLIGTVTYGKGSVQNWVPLDQNQGAVRITMARWLTPKKHQINEIGLTPDLIVNISEQDIKNGHDSQLDKAIEVLTNQVGK